MLHSAYKYINFAWKIILSNLGMLRQPYKLFVVVTKSCDSACTNCSIWKEKPHHELDLSEYEKIAKNIGPHLSWLNISGGEPTNREDLIEIIKIFQKFCPNLLILNFTTNGLRVDRIIKVADFLEKSNIPIIGVNVSIDGPEEAHIKLRGGANSYQLAIKSLETIRKYSRIKVHASMTLFDQNAHLVEETFLNIKKYIPSFTRDELNLNYSLHSKHFYQNHENAYSNVEVNRYFKNLKVSILSISLFSMMKKLYLKQLKKYIETNQNPIHCSALRSNIYISEHGEVFSCTIWNKNVGGLRDNDYDLSLILKHPEAVKLRNQIEKNLCPNCWSPCEAFPSILDNLPKALM